MGRPSPRSEELRADAVRLVVGSILPRSIDEVAMELGLNRETLRSWVRRGGKEKASEAAGGLSAAEREELKQLRRRVKVLEKKEILGKATALFPASGRRCRSSARITPWQNTGPPCAGSPSRPAVPRSLYAAA